MSCCYDAGANIYFNIINKQLLNVFPAPYFIATMQLGALPTAAKDVMLFAELQSPCCPPRPSRSSQLLALQLAAAWWASCCGPHGCRRPQRWSRRCGKRSPQ